jgi:hypothetical protein
VPEPIVHPPRHRRGTELVLALAVMALAVSCAKVEDQPAAPSRGREVTYVAVKVIPAGKTVRAAKADGSIELQAVPSDVLGGDGVDDAGPIECQVAGRAVPAGTVLRRSLFVDPGELGLDRGLTDGTTVDSEC